MNVNETIQLLQGSRLNKVNASKDVDETTPQQTEAGDTTIEADTDDARAVVAAPSPREEFSTFLTLLTAQIQNQDPLAPLDSTQFVEQLATFTNLELQATGNQSLELIATLLAQQIDLLTPTDQATQSGSVNIDATA